jgi:hypothetical protein
MVDMLLETSRQADAGEIPAARCHELEQVLGLNVCPHGLLATVPLRPLFDPIQVCRYDWVHTLLQDGVFTIEAQCLLHVCNGFGITREQVQVFLKDTEWCFPSVSKSKAAQLHRVFDPRRQSENNEDRLKCSASELLGLYGMLRHFIELHVPELPELAPYRASFDAVCRVLDILLQLKRRTVSIEHGVHSLKEAVSRHLQLHITAYGTGRVVPKHHWLLDVPGQIEKDKLVLDAFVIERQHLTVKSVVEHVRNTIVFEKSVMSSVCTLTANQAEAAVFGNSLNGARPAPDLAPDALIGPSMVVFGFTVATHDVILRTTDQSAGIVIACCGDRFSLYVIVEVLSVVGQQCRHARAWKRSGRREVWPADDLEHCLAWYLRGDGSWVVVER